MRHWIALLALAALSAFFQFANVRQTEQGGVVHGDAVKYVFYAYNLKHHDTFSRLQTFGAQADVAPVPDKLTLPGYAWFVSKFLGDGPPDQAFLWRIETAQALLGVTTTLLAFLVALRLAPFWWAFASGVLVATQPHLVVISDYLLTETLFTPLLLAFVLAFLRAAATDGNKWHAAIAGLLLGAACLVRPQLQLVPWLVLLAVCCVPRLRARWKQAALGALLFAAVVVPWQVRNAQVPLPAGEPDLLVQSIYHGAFPGMMYEGDLRTLGYAYRHDPEAAAHSRDLPAVMDFIGEGFAAHPARYAYWYFVDKPLLFLAWSHVAGVGDIFIYPVTHSPWVERPLFRAVRGVHWWLHWPLMLLMLGTLIVALRRPASLTDDVDRRRSIVLVAMLLASMLVLHVIGLALPRYNLPFRPLEFALAMVGLRAAWMAVRARREAGASLRTRAPIPASGRPVRFDLLVIAVGLLAFMLREYYVLAARVDMFLVGDARDYWSYAWNVFNHGVFSGTEPPRIPVPDAYRLPGYPWLIVLAMRIAGGAWYPLMLLMQAVMGAMTAVFVTLLARHWLSVRWSIAAGLLIALWPHHVAATNTLLSEVLLGFLLTGSLLAFARGWTTGRTAWFVVAGAAFGYAWLVNPVLTLFPPLLAALAWWHGRRRPTLVLLALFLVPVIGMAVRNASIDAPGSAERATLNFVQGSWPEYHDATNRFRTGDKTAIAIMREIDEENAALVASKPAGIARIGERFASWPSYYAKWYASKPWLLWGWQIRVGATDISYHRVEKQPFETNPLLRAWVVTLRTLNPLLTTIMLVAAIALVVRGVRKANCMPAVATGLLALYVTLVHLVLQAEPRYATAYRGIETVLLVTALAYAANWLRTKLHAARSSAGAGAAGSD